MCLRQLLERNNEWKFWTNPAASEMPILAVEEMSATLRDSGESIVVSSNNTNPQRHKLFRQLVRYVYLKRAHLKIYITHLVDRGLASIK